MDKSGSRYPHLKSPIIELPDQLQPEQKIINGVITLAFWAFWFYLCLPLFALLAWALGIQQAYKYMIVLGGYNEMVRLLGIYALVILVLGGSLIVWAVSNIMRFKGVENRVANRPISQADISRVFGITEQDVEKWQGEQHLLVTHDLKGKIQSVEVSTAKAIASV
jgi:biofilm PGA synthesis protein PgaD